MYKMKNATKSSIPVLSGKILTFFYKVLTIWESSEEKKVIKDFNSSEIRRFLIRKDSRGKQILFFSTDLNKTDFNHKYALYLRNSKKSKGLSLLYQLRNAFAHNDILISNDGKQIIINHEWKGVCKLKTKIPFTVLKELVETIRGEHNLTETEKKKKYSNKKKHK